MMLVCWFQLAMVVVLVAAEEPTEKRQWTAVSGHKIVAIALKVTGDKVILKHPDGKTVEVPIEKFVEADRKFIEEHFELGNTDDGGAEPDADARDVADDLPHPLGKATGEIACEDGFSYYLYLPKSLRKAKKHPVLYIMSPGGGSPGAANRYINGAERNGWILAVSKQSKNGFKQSTQACDAMMNHVESTLPIDVKRIYMTGFSGGSRMAYLMSQQRKKVTGVIACGAGGKIGSKKQIVYGLCGTNCFNRTGMANAFKGVSHKGAVLRYFPGKHDWANDELCEDAITHLNGVFLSSNKSGYGEDYAEYLRQLGNLIADSVESKPLRAYMWSDFAQQYIFEDPRAAKAYSELGADGINKLYVKGLFGIRKFVEKTFEKMSNSQWKSDPKVSSACKREAKKYTGTPWEEVLNKMSEDAQKF